MIWSNEQVFTFINNPYAQNMAESLLCDVYPNIMFLMKKLGMTNLEFSLGKHNNSQVYYKCNIVFNHRNMSINIIEDGLEITFQKCQLVNVASYLTGFSQTEEQVISYRNFYYVPNDTQSYYFTSEHVTCLKLKSKEPVFVYLNSFQIDNHCKNPTEFYLFYCNNIIKTLEELKNTYRDGFIRLQDKLRTLVFPIERIVIFEKKKNNNNHI